MESGKRYAPWWMEALTAVLWMLAALFGIAAVTLHGRAGGWSGLSIIPVPLCLLAAAVFAVRAARALRERSAADGERRD